MIVYINDMYICNNIKLSLPSADSKNTWIFFCHERIEKLAIAIIDTGLEN